MPIKPIRNQQNLLIKLFIKTINIRLRRHVGFVFLVTYSPGNVQLTINPILAATLKDQPTLINNGRKLLLV